MFEEVLRWRGTKYKLVRRGSRTYSPGQVKFSYQPPSKRHIERYRARGSSMWDTPGAVVEFPDGTNLVRDGHHRFSAGMSLRCERYVAVPVR